MDIVVNDKQYQTREQIFTAWSYDSHLDPFVHTLICGDINGLFGNIFTDEEIDHGGSIMDSYFEVLAMDGFRLPPAKGSSQKIIETSIKLLDQLFVTN